MKKKITMSVLFVLTGLIAPLITLITRYQIFKNEDKVLTFWGVLVIAFLGGFCYYCLNEFLKLKCDFKKWYYRFLFTFNKIGLPLAILIISVQLFVNFSNDLTELIGIIFLCEMVASIFNPFLYYKEE